MILLGTILLIINFVLTYKIVRNTELKTFQKTILLIIVWIAPFVGAIIVDLLFDKQKK